MKEKTMKVRVNPKTHKKLKLLAVKQSTTMAVIIDRLLDPFAKKKSPR